MEIDFTPDEEATPPAAIDVVNFVPDEDFIAQKAADPEFNAIAYAHENPDQKDIARQIYVAQKETPAPMTVQRAVGLGGKVIEGAKGMLSSLGEGMGNIGFNTAVLMDNSGDIDPVNKERAKTEVLATAQTAEANSKNFIGGLFGKDSWLRRNIFSTTPDPERAPAPTDYDPNTDKPADRYGRQFDTALDHLSKTEKLAMGIPSDEGLVASGVEAINQKIASDTGLDKPDTRNPELDARFQEVAKAKGLPLQEITMPTKPSETFMSGPEMEKNFGAGTGTSEESIRTGGTISPDLLLPMHIPGAQVVGGGALRAVGKTLQAPAWVAEKTGSLIGGRAGKALAYGVGGGAAASLAINNPEKAIEIGALALGLKGAKVIGKLMDTAGAKLINPKTVSNAQRAAGQELMDINDSGKGSVFFNKKVNKADLESALTRPIAGAAQGAAGMAPLAALTANSPEEGAEQIGGGAAFGGLAGGINHNPMKGFRAEHLAGVDAVLRENGAKDYGTDLDASHNDYVSGLSKDSQDGINAYRGFFQGFKLANGVEPQIYVLPAGKFAEEVVKLRPDLTPEQAAQARGYTAADGRVLVNGDAGPPGRTLGHESGHVVANILATVGPEIVKSMRGAAEKGLFENGQPTPAMQKFVDEYNKQAGSKEIDNNPKAISEWLAEQASEAMDGGGPAKYAAGSALREKITDNVRDYFKQLFGTENEFDRESVPALARQYRELLFGLGRLKGEEPMTGRDVPPEPQAEPVAATPAAEPAKPGEAPVEVVRPDGAVETPVREPAASEANQQSRLEALGIDPDVVEAHRDAAIDDAQGKARNKKAAGAQAGAEFDKQVERYYAALEAAGVPHPEGLDLGEALRLNELTLSEGGIPAHGKWAERQAGAPLAQAAEPRVVDEPLAGQEDYPYKANDAEVNSLKKLGWNDAEIAAMPESQVLRVLNEAPTTPAAAKPLEGLTNEANRTPSTSTPPRSEPVPQGAAQSPSTPPGVQTGLKGPSAATLKGKLKKAGSDPDKQLQVMKDLLGPGEVKLDRKEPLHIAILNHFKYSGPHIDNIEALQNNLGKGVVLRDYKSAEQEGHETGQGLDLSGGKRKSELAASPTGEAGQRRGEITKQDKGFTPYETIVTKKGVIIRGFDHDKFLDNTRKVLDAAEAAGVKTGFEGLKGADLDNAVADAFGKVAENHTHAHSGTGEPLPESARTKKMVDDPNFVPHEVDADQAATINMAMHIQGEAEKNPLRAKIKASGFDVDHQLKTTVSNIRPDLIEKGVAAEPLSGRSVHAHGFDIPASKLTEKATPHAKPTEEGFLPGGALAELGKPSQITKLDEIAKANHARFDRFDEHTTKKNQFTIYDPNNREAPGTTLYVDKDASPAQIKEAIDKKRAEFEQGGKRAVGGDNSVEEMIKALGPNADPAMVAFLRGESGFLPGGKETETKLQDIQRQIDNLWYTKPRDEEQIQRLRDEQQALLREQASDTPAKEAPQRSEREVVPSRPANELPEGHRVIAHWSPQEGLSEIDPAKHGTGRVGAERERKAAFPDRYVDRSYFGYGDYKQESGTGKNRYSPDVDFKLLYDYPKDPLDLWSVAERQAGANASDAAKATEYERLIKDHGYLGYYNDKAQVAATFHKVPAEGSIGGEAFANSSPDHARRSPEMMRVLHDYVPEIHKIAPDYFQQKPADKAQVAKQNEIAKEYEGAKVDNLSDPKVKKAYSSLVEKVNDQYDKVLEGVDVEPWADKQEDGTWKPREGQPYKTSGDMQEDMRKNKHLYFFGTTPESFGSTGNFSKDNPMFQQSGKTTDNGYPLMNNDILRAVHDAIAHGSFGVQFGPSGEEAAWRAHMATINDPWARWALTTETRGQNSWVNFRDEHLNADGTPKKKGDPGYVPPTERPFADQKADLLDPKWMLTGDPTVDKVVKDFNPNASESKPEEGFLPAPAPDSKEFKGWFGDSKVVDEDGNALVVNHGTHSYTDPKTGKRLGVTKPEDVFDRKFTQEFFGRKPGMDHIGSWFTTNPNSAGKYGPEVTQVYLSIKKPFVLTGQEGQPQTATAKLRKLMEAKGGPDNVVEALKKGGYDGIHIKNDMLDHLPGDVWVAFEPNQIKSATENSGAYSAEDPRIGFLPARKQPKEEAQDNGFRISTMRPWGKPGDSFVEEGQHTVSAAPFLEKPKLGEKAANFFKEEGYLSDLIDKDHRKTIENVTNRIVDNLLWLHDKFKPELRGEAKKWYDGARKISERWAEEYGHPRQAIAGVMAALSPQLDWYQNVSLAKRVLDIYRDQQDTKWTPEMDQAVERISKMKTGGIEGLKDIVKPIRGRAFKDLDTDEKAVFTRLYDEAHNSRDYDIVSPSGDFMGPSKTKGGKNQKVSWRSLDPIEKAISAIEDPTLEGISYNIGTGHKVRNFFNNILLPNGFARRRDDRHPRSGCCIANAFRCCGLRTEEELRRDLE
jgi:hypothetical protein